MTFLILEHECLKNCTHIPPSKVAQDYKNNNSISEGISSQCGTFSQSDIYKKLFVDHRIKGGYLVGISFRK